MKKDILFLLAILVIFSSCGKDAYMNVSNNQILLANVPSPEQTKTTVVKNGEVYNVKWTAGDQLHVVGKSNFGVPYYYQLQEESIGSTTGKFKSIGDYCQDDSGILASYPKNWTNTSTSGDYIYVNIPNNQNISIKGIAPMIGKGTLAEGVDFCHISSILRLRLYTETPNTYISNIEVTNDSPIAGNIYAPATQYEEPDWIFDYVDKEYVINYNCENLPLSTSSANPTEVDILVGDVPRSGKNLTLDNFSILISTTSNTFFSITKGSQSVIPPGNVVKFSVLNCAFQSQILKIKYGDDGNWEPYSTPIRTDAMKISIKTEGNSIITEAQWEELLSAINSSTVAGGVDVDLSEASFYLQELPDSWCASNNSIKSIALPKNITKCGIRLMEGSSKLQQITFPASITKIGSLAGSGCNKLTAFVVDENNNNFSVIDGILYNFDATEILRYPRGKNATQFSIPNTVTKIEQYAIQDNTFLTELTIPSSVTTVPNWCFNGMSCLDHIYCSWTDNIPAFAKSSGCGTNALNRIIHIPPVTGLKAIYNENWKALTTQTGAEWTIDDGM